MQAKLVFHDADWVEGDFEPPANLKGKRILNVWRFERESGSGRLTMKLDRGAGIWDRSGQLLFYDPHVADFSFAERGRLRSIENRFEHASGSQRPAHRLQLREGHTLAVLEETVLSVPTGGVEYLIVSPTEDRCLVTWLDQSQWGYVIASLPAMTQAPGGLFYPTASVVPPAISPDGTYAVACSFIRAGWWTDVVDDYWDAPSPGGLRKLAAISVDVFAERTTTWHDLLIRLEPGWIPESGYTSSWDMAWGPEFVDDQHVRIWLPDDSSEVLSLPLPPRVLIGRPLGRRRGG
jgi:hypothetical protein